MPKTVTLQKARPGRIRVTVADWTFPLGEPVREVPDPIVKQLKAMPGVQIHVAASHRDDDPSTEADQ